MNIQVVNNRVINLENVSTIKVDEVKERIYFNMNFAIQNSNGTYIQDYVYVKNTEDTLNSIINNLNTCAGFIKYDKNKWVNLKQISSMKYDKESKRIIMNLSNPHTYEFQHGSKVLAEFIYMENVTEDDFLRITNIIRGL